MSIEREQFWMVWRERSSGMNYRHPTKKAALDEAGRLALANPGEVFFVLKATAGLVAEIPLIQTVKMVTDPIPF